MTKKAKTASAVVPQVEIPEGYDAVNPHQVTSWYRPEPGVVCHGDLLGRFVMTGDKNQKADGKQRAYYQLRLVRAITAVGPKDSSKKPTLVDLVEGDIINVDERAGLLQLKELVGKSEVYRVFIQPLEKIALDGGRTFWRFNVFKKSLGVISTMVPPASVEVDDTPF